MTDKVLTLLGFAAKSGNLCYGFAATTAAIKTNKTFLAVCASDISPKTRKEVAFFAGKAQIPLLSLSVCDRETLSKAVGRSCGVLGITDRPFAESVLKAAKSGGNVNE